MPLESLTQNPFGRGEVSTFTEPELNGVAIAGDCTIEIPPLTTHPDVRFIHVPLAGDRPLTPVELLQQKRSIVDGPAMDSGMIDRDAALGRYFLEISQARIVGQVPPDEQGDIERSKCRPLNIGHLRSWPET